MGCIEGDREGRRRPHRTGAEQGAGSPARRTEKDTKTRMRSIFKIFALPALVLTLLGAGAEDGAAQTGSGRAKSGAASGRDLKSAENSIIDAVQLYDGGEYVKAAALLDKISKAAPDNDAALYYRGLCKLRLGDSDGAIGDLKAASAIDTANYWYRYTLAGIYGVTGQTELTEAMYESLLRDFPGKSELHYNLANIYLSQGQLDKALATVNDIETRFGKTDGTVLTRFNILNKQNRQEDAFRILEEYSRESSSPQVLTMLGDYAMGMYNDSTALARYDEALSLDRDYAPALLGKAEAYRITRKYPEYFRVLDGLMADRDIPSDAKADYLQALLKQSDPRFILSFKPQFDSTMAITSAVHPADSSVLETSGLYYYMTGRKEEAAGKFLRIMDLYPDNASAAANYIQILISDNAWEQVVSESEAAYLRFPGQIGFLEYSNAARYNLKDYRGIIANCEKMLAAAPGDSAVYVGCLSIAGDMYYQLGEKDKAYKAYEKVLKAAPNHAPVLNNYAYFLAVDGKKLKKACAMSRKAVAAEPDNATYLDTLGWILYLQGKAGEAKTYFKQAVIYGGKESATILAHYAEVLKALGETDLADLYLEQARTKQQ